MKTIIQSTRYATGSLSVAVLIALTCGCTTQKLPEYQPDATVSTVRVGQQAGLEVALDPFVEPGRTQQFFGMDAVAKGTAVLHVHVSNQTATQTFLVEKKNFYLMLNGSLAGPSADADKNESLKASGEVVSAVGAFAGSTALYLIGIGMLSHSSEVERNFIEKEMPDQTLPPGRSMEGFIYFGPLRKGENWSRAATVMVSLTDTTTHQATKLTIPLSH